MQHFVSKLKNIFMIYGNANLSPICNSLKQLSLSVILQLHCASEKQCSCFNEL